MTGRYGEDAYPLGRLILARASTLRLSRTEFVHRLGYLSFPGGHRALSVALLTGRPGPFIMENLARALELDQGVIDDAIAATVAQHKAEAIEQRSAREREYYTAFRPYLRAETECQLPPVGQIVIAGLGGFLQRRIVPVHNRVWRVPEEMRDRIVKSAILEHYREQKGQVPTLGKIIEYSLVLAPGVYVDIALPYDVRGDRAGAMRTVRRLGSISISVKGRALPPTLLVERVKS